VAQDANVEMHLKADRATRYEAVAETMSAARRAGLTKIGFVTQPGAGSN
jgi:biopolymer transport protein ExbD